jgi:aminoglycoside phosphotransferase family enzyme/predicted kinase
VDEEVGVAPPATGGPAAPPDQLVETHISTLVFLGDRVYKRMRPVHLPFLDLRNRAARERLCHRAVELNRRLAPDVYLGVADVIGPDGEPCEHLVVMRRLPDDRRLSALVRAGDPAAGPVVDEVAERLAALHAVADRGPEVARDGTPDALASRWDALFAEIRPYAGTVVDPGELAEADRRHRIWCEGRRALLDERVAAGAIRDGHGDLQADDIFCTDEGAQILDCIDFDDHLRHVDIADDVAFLVMDLDRLAAPELAERFVRAYEAASGEPLPAGLVALYAAYRALVRSMVACVRTDEPDAGPEIATLARDLLHRCVEHLHAAQPRLVLVGGLPGTGKSTVAAGIGAATGWTVLRSDVVRKELAGLAPDARPSAERDGPGQIESLDHGLYDPAMTDRVYAALAERARHELEHGRSVVADASLHRAAPRDVLRAAAREARAPVVELCCVAPTELTTERLVARAAAGSDASDATPNVAAAMAGAWEPWAEAVRVDAARPRDDVIEAALAMATADLDPPD